MMEPQDVDQIRDSAVNLVRALEVFQLAHLNLLGNAPDDVQAVGLARLLNRIGMSAVAAVVRTPAPKVAKPRKVYKARKLPMRVAPQNTLSKNEQRVLKIMPNKEFLVKALAVPADLQGQKIVSIIGRLHKLGFIRRVRKMADRTTVWQLVEKR